MWLCQWWIPLNNIITHQDVAHTNDNDMIPPLPPRMLIKLDIEKAYDMLTWITILAILTKMSFPGKWIIWIKTCISSASYAILVNKNLTS